MTEEAERKEIVDYVAAALKNSGKTMDADNWFEVMAEEAVAAIVRLGRSKGQL